MGYVSPVSCQLTNFYCICSFWISSAFKWQEQFTNVWDFSQEQFTQARTAFRLKLSFLRNNTDDRLYALPLLEGRRIKAYFFRFLWEYFYRFHRYNGVSKLIRCFKLVSNASIRQWIVQTTKFTIWEGFKLQKLYLGISLRGKSAPSSLCDPSNATDWRPFKQGFKYFWKISLVNITKWYRSQIFMH